MHSTYHIVPSLRFSRSLEDNASKLRIKIRTDARGLLLPSVRRKHFLRIVPESRPPNLTLVFESIRLPDIPWNPGQTVERHESFACE